MTQEAVPAVSEILICLHSPYDLYPEQKLNPKELKEGIQSDVKQVKQGVEIRSCQQQTRQKETVFSP